MKINLHIGVHKTASTYIQNRLHANKAALHSAGIGYADLWEFRTFFTEKFMDFAPESFRLEDHIAKFFGGTAPETVRGLVISEENMIGYCGGFLMSGNPFTSSTTRLAHLRRLFAGHDVTLFCAIRSYDTFLSSAYCEGLRNLKTYVPFDDLRQKLHWARMQWPYLIESFEQNLCPADTQIWRYEQFRENADRIMGALTFETGIKLAEPTTDNAEYPSFSKTAIDVLAAVAAQVGAKAANALIVSAASLFPKGEAYPAFNPWAANEEKLLKRLYEQDVQAIEPAKWLLRRQNSQTVTKAA